MHVTKKPSERIIAPDPETATFKSVAVELKGRLMCSDFSEYKCVTVAMSPIVVDFRCAARPRAGEYTRHGGIDGGGDGCGGASHSGGVGWQRDE